MCSSPCSMSPCALSWNGVLALRGASRSAAIRHLSRSYPKTVIASEAWQSRSWNRLENRPAIPRIPVTDSVFGIASSKCPHISGPFWSIYRKSFRRIARKIYRCVLTFLYSPRTTTVLKKIAQPVTKSSNDGKRSPSRYALA